MLIVGLIHETVTVVVDSVTGLCYGEAGIALRKTLFRAYALARARAQFISAFAGCPEAERDRFTGARARASISYALRCVDAIDGDRR